MLGHATISVTLDTYSHILPDMQKEAARAIDINSATAVMSRVGQALNSWSFGELQSMTTDADSV